MALRQPFGPLEEHPLGFRLGPFCEIGLDLFNQGSDFRRCYFEGRIHGIPLLQITWRETNQIPATSNQTKARPLAARARGQRRRGGDGLVTASRSQGAGLLCHWLAMPTYARSPGRPPRWLGQRAAAR